jgi:hypothetical protein
MTYEVTLSEDTLDTICREAAARHADYEDGDNVKETRTWNIDEGDTHVRGLKGEFAFAKKYGLEPDLDQHDTGDCGVDFTATWDGHTTADVTIDVKTVSYPSDPWLCVRHNAADYADRFVLASTLDGSNTVNLHGWETKETVLETQPTERTGHTLNYILQESDVRALPDPALINPATDTDDTGPSKTTRRRPPAATFALRTRDTSDEYAESRIKNTDSADYLDAILQKEVARDNPRQQRIAWINQRRREIPDE